MSGKTPLIEPITGLKYPMIVKSAGRIKTIVGPLSSESEPFRHDKGYILNDEIWIFNKEKPNTSEYPYFWYEHGKICFGKVRDSIKNDFRVENLSTLDPTYTVCKLDPNVPLYDEQALSDMNAATTMFEPEIKESDDCLKKLIKISILDKKINIARLKSVTPTSYMLSNLKTALINGTKMSITNFIIWCDLLGLTFDIIVSDNGTDYQNPLKKSIHYCGETDIYEKIEKKEKKR